MVDKAEFLLKNNFSEFDSKVKQEISGTAIVTKFAPQSISLIDQHLETDSYCKPADYHQFLDFNFAILSRHRKINSV